MIKKRFIKVLPLLLLVMATTVSAQNVNLTSILQKFSSDRHVTISFSPTLTNQVYPKNYSLEGDAAAVLTNLLKGTSLAFKPMGSGFYIYKVAQPAPKPVVKAPAPAPKPQPAPEPEPQPAPEPEPACWSIKTNALADLTTTLNFGFEVGLAKQWTLELSAYVNPWKFGDKQFQHVMLQPEARYWFNERFSGHFIGLQAHAGLVDASSWPQWSNWLGGQDTPTGNGAFAGAGFGYGYQWKLAEHWHMEAEAAVGYSYLMYENKVRDNYLGVTKLSVGVSYLF